MHRVAYVLVRGITHSVQEYAIFLSTWLLEVVSRAANTITANIGVLQFH